jgi:hypothetical protein
VTAARGNVVALGRGVINLGRGVMTSLPLVLDDEPIGIILRVGRRLVRPARIWAYCWCADADESQDEPPHRKLPVEHPR